MARTGNMPNNLNRRAMQAVILRTSGARPSPAILKKETFPNSLNPYLEELAVIEAATGRQNSGARIYRVSFN
jgi:hypothetical protein